MKKIIISWLFCLVTVFTFGQDVCRWYRYLQGQKICHEISETKFILKSETLTANDLEKALQNTVAGSLKEIYSLYDKELFLIEMENTGKENLLELIHQWKYRDDVLSVSPVFLDEYGDEIDGYTNEVIVRLNSKDDYPVLQECAEAYQLTNIRPNEFDNEFDELQYYLTLPRNAQKNALQIANELYETGFFQWVEPNYVIFAYLGTGNSNYWELRNESSPFTVYPNPANDVLYIDIDRQALDNPACEIHIYSLNGSKALQTATNGNEVKINVSVLQNGIYFLHIHDISNSKQETRKIVIKH